MVHGLSLSICSVVINTSAAQDYDISEYRSAHTRCTAVTTGRDVVVQDSLLHTPRACIFPLQRSRIPGSLGRRHPPTRARRPQSHCYLERTRGEGPRRHRWHPVRARARKRVRRELHQECRTQRHPSLRLGPSAIPPGTSQSLIHTRPHARADRSSCPLTRSTSSPSYSRAHATSCALPSSSPRS